MIRKRRDHHLHQMATAYSIWTSQHDSMLLMLSYHSITKLTANYLHRLHAYWPLEMVCIL